MNNAFLRGDLAEEVYMFIPQGFKPSKPNQVCHLQKSLYDLKQGSHQWFAKLSSALTSCGYKASDHSLFLKHSSGSITTLLVYVDDVILTGDSLPKIESIKQFLDSKFKIKDLGDLKYSLGLEVQGWHFPLSTVSQLGLRRDGEREKIKMESPPNFIRFRKNVGKNLLFREWSLKTKSEFEVNYV